MAIAIITIPQAKRHLKSHHVVLQKIDINKRGKVLDCIVRREEVFLVFMFILIYLFFSFSLLLKIDRQIELSESSKMVKKLHEICTPNMYFSSSTVTLLLVVRYARLNQCYHQLTCFWATWCGFTSCLFPLSCNKQYLSSKKGKPLRIMSSDFKLLQNRNTEAD